MVAGVLRSGQQKVNKKWAWDKAKIIKSTLRGVLSQARICLQKVLYIHSLPPKQCCKLRSSVQTWEPGGNIWHSSYKKRAVLRCCSLKSERMGYCSKHESQKPVKMPQLSIDTPIKDLVCRVIRMRCLKLWLVIMWRIIQSITLRVRLRHWFLSGRSSVEPSPPPLLMTLKWE